MTIDSHQMKSHDEDKKTLNSTYGQFVKLFIPIGPMKGLCDLAVFSEQNLLDLDDFIVVYTDDLLVNNEVASNVYIHEEMRVHERQNYSYGFNHWQR